MNFNNIVASIKSFFVTIFQGPITGFLWLLGKTGFFPVLNETPKPAPDTNSSQ